MSVLRTDFSGAFDSGLFTKTELSGSVTQTGGEIVFNGMDEFVLDNTAVDVTADNFAVEISSYPATNNDYRFFLGIIDAAGRGVGMKISPAGMFATHRQDSGTPKNLIDTALSSIGGWSNTYTYLRVRVAAGDSFMEYSTNGSSWTSLATVSLPSGFSVSAAKGFFGIGGAFNTCVYKVTNYWAPAIPVLNVPATEADGVLRPGRILAL